MDGVEPETLFPWTLLVTLFLITAELVLEMEHLQSHVLLTMFHLLETISRNFYLVFNQPQVLLALLVAFPLVPLLVGSIRRSEHIRKETPHGLNQ